MFYFLPMRLRHTYHVLALLTKNHELKHSLPSHHMPIVDCNSRNFPTVAKVRMISRDETL
jgi:hypothetical protein